MSTTAEKSSSKGGSMRSSTVTTSIKMDGSKVVTEEIVNPDGSKTVKSVTYPAGVDPPTAPGVGKL